MLAGTFDFYKTRGNFIDQIYLPFHIEFFWNLNDTQSFNDVIKITPDIWYTVNASWKLEFSTSYHRRNVDVGDEFNTNDIVFRFRVFHNLN